ncbi:MAG: ABC transporter permease [Acidimicrobiales bacterium]|jgi:ABC-2 type transport system permease protein|nr:ABC transporter permease [Acidimicrobiales bacterium]HLV90049.1 ABC transporter permease [Acidimicrobiia bacterium]
MRNLGLVALREMREGLRSKTFLITTLVTMGLVAAIILLPQMLGGGTQNHTVGLVGDGSAEIVDTAVRLGNAADEDGEEPSVAIETREYASRDEGVTALQEGEVEALVVDGEEVVLRNIGIMGSGVTGLLQQAAAARSLEEVLEEHGQVAAVVIETLTSDPLRVTTPDGDADEEGGQRWIVAQAGMFLLYMAILIYGSWILTGVTEEKSSRVVEVLLSAVHPWQLLGGKVLGIGGLGLAQFIITIIVALAAVNYTGIEIPALEPVLLGNLVLWFILGFLVFAVLFGAAGSLASRTEDAQGVAMPMSMIAVAGLFISFAALENPEGTVAVVGSLVPFTAPFVVPVRVALDAIPWWQYALSVGLAILGIVIFVRIAGRIYSGALLRFGTRTKFRDAWRSADL